MLQNAIEETKQFHQKFVRNVLKRFCYQTTFVTNFVDPQTGTRTLQFSKGPVCICLFAAGRSGKKCCLKKDFLQSISKLVQWWLWSISLSCTCMNHIAQCLLMRSSTQRLSQPGVLPKTDFLAMQFPNLKRKHFAHGDISCASAHWT